MDGGAGCQAEEFNLQPGGEEEKRSLQGGQGYSWPGSGFLPLHHPSSSVHPPGDRFRGLRCNHTVWFGFCPQPCQGQGTSCFQNPLEGCFLVFLYLTTAVSLAYPCILLALSSLWLWSPHCFVPSSPQTLLHLRLLWASSLSHILEPHLLGSSGVLL